MGISRAGSITPKRKQERSGGGFHKEIPIGQDKGRILIWEGIPRATFQTLTLEARDVRGVKKKDNFWGVVKTAVSQDKGKANRGVD